MNKWQLAVWVGLLGMVLLGCGKKAVVHKYYLIELPGLPLHKEFQKPMRPEAVCEILPVTISSAFANRRIAIRKKNYEISYFVYHQWASPPAEIMTSLVEKFMLNAALFGEVSGEAWRSLPDYRIKGYVHQLEVRKEKGSFIAHLHMDLFLIDTEKRQAVVQYSFDRYQPLARKDLDEFAGAISNILKQGLLDFSKKIRAYFKRIELPQSVGETKTPDSK